MPLLSVEPPTQTYLSRASRRYSTRTVMFLAALAISRAISCTTHLAHARRVTSSVDRHVPVEVESQPAHARHLVCAAPALEHFWVCCPPSRPT